MAASEPAPGPVPAANEPARPALAALRRRIAVLEGTAGAARADATASRAEGAEPAHRAAPARTDEAARVLATGVAGFDRLFGQGGLVRGALHEVVTDEARGGGAAAGFAVALLARAAAAGVPGAVLWASDAFAAREAGGPPYGPGLHALGLDPGRLVCVEGGRVADVLWALEEGLGSGALFAVVGEVLGRPAGLDLTATRRLMLRAREAGRTAILLGHATGAAPSAAATRIRVAPHASADPFGPGRPAWRLSVEKNRDGPTGSAVMEWDPHERAFHEHAFEERPFQGRPLDGRAVDERAGDGRALRGPAPHPRRVAAAPVDRPAGAVVALRPPAAAEPGHPPGAHRDAS